MSETITKVIKNEETGLISLTDWDKLKDSEVVSMIVDRFDLASKNDKRTEREAKWVDAYEHYIGEYTISGKKQSKAIKTTTLFILIENLMAKMFRIMFHDEKVITVDPANPETPFENSKIIENWLTQTLKDNKYKNKFARFLKQVLIYGTGVIKVGWYQKEMLANRRRDLYDGGTMVNGENVIEKRPYFEAVDVMDVYPDPDAQNVDDISYVFHKIKRRLSQLLNNREQYMNLDELVKYKTSRNNQSEATTESIKQLNQMAGQSTDDANNYTDKDLSYDRYDPLVELLVYYEADRLVVVADKTILLRNDPNPFWNKKIPFIFAPNYIDFNTPYGFGDVEMGIKFQELEDVMTMMLYDYMKSILKVKLLVPDTVKIDEKALVDMDNRVVHCDAPGEVVPLQIPAIQTNSGIALIEKLQMKMEDLTSMTGYQRGAPVRQETAAGVYQIQEAGNTKLLLKVDMMEPTLQGLADWFIELNHQFMDDEAFVRGRDEKGSDTWITMTPEMFAKSYKYSFVGSANAENKDILYNKAVALYNMLVNRPDIDQDYLLEYMISMASLPNINVDRLTKSQGVEGVGRIEQQLAQGAINNGGEAGIDMAASPMENARLQRSEANNPLNSLNGGFNG